MADDHFSNATVAFAERLVACLTRAAVYLARSVDDDIAFGGGWGIGLMPPRPDPAGQTRATDQSLH